MMNPEVAWSRLTGEEKRLVVNYLLECKRLREKKGRQKQCANVSIEIGNT